MLDYNILSNKPYIKIPSKFDESEYVLCKDLSASTLNLKSKIVVYKMVTITPDYIARPDLVSLAMYGTDEYADIICKINGISNPFELNEGMELIIPEFSNIYDVFSSAAASSTVADNSFIGKGIKTNQKAKNMVRKPSEQIIGDSNFTIDKTNKIVIY
jgi:hypothetical protein